jgi:hypothetical protein
MKTSFSKKLTGKCLKELDLLAIAMPACASPEQLDQTFAGLPSYPLQKKSIISHILHDVD